jgi:Ca2+-binding RTX toxin-like protein
MTDGHGGTATNAVTVNVAPREAQVVTNAGAIVVSSNTAVRFSIAELLAHDKVADNDSATIVKATAYDASTQRAPINVAINADGTISFQSGSLATGQLKGYITFTLSNGDVLTAAIELVNVTGGGGDFDSAASSNDPLASTALDNYWASYLDAQEGPDTLAGAQLVGGASGGYDVFLGSGGNDTLVGRGGNDTLIGGEGQDQLTGGGGSDKFVFESVSASEVGSKRDVITDFQIGIDKIDLRGIDARTMTSGDQAFTFVSTATQNVQANSITWYVDSASNRTIVQGDVNGDGAADFQIELSGQMNLTSSDFFL